MRSSIIICLLLFCASQLPAQSLSVFNIDTTNFPTMKAKFYAFDANGMQQSPSASEITVSENGIARNVTSISCPPKQSVPRISLAMSLDVSGSMQSSDFGDIPVELGKATMSKLIPLIADGASEFALQTCNDHAVILQDFTTKRNNILAEITPITAGGGNDFVEHLLNPLTGILNVAKTGKYKRVAVLYTDAWWTALSANELQQCIDLCAKNGITFYAIIYSRPESEPNGIKSSLRQIAEATGGMMFDGVNSQQAANNVAAQIQEFIQNGGSSCEITWQSNVSCVAGATNVQFVWSGQTAQFTYAPPANSVAGLQFTPQSLYIRSKPAGVKFDTTVTITANNSAFSVTNITSTNPSYDINPKSFVLAAGKSQALIISYTPSDSSYTWTRFEIASDLCPQTYYASGSYPGHKPTVPTLKLTHPNGGEQLLVGSDTVITWTGMPLTDTVKLEYSTDDGNSWNFITDKATGGRYGWHVPKTVSDICLARVKEYLGDTTSNWVRSAGGNDNGYGQAITVDNLGNIYITGSFVGTANFGGIMLHSIGGPSKSDIFIVKYRPDGSVEWAKREGGSGTEGGRGIAADAMGNVYITGYFYSGSAVFDNITLTNADSAGRWDDVFLAKYHSDGTLEWAKQMGGKLSDEGTGINVDASNNIYVTGNFNDTINFKGTVITSSGSSDIFVAKFDSAGNIIWMKSAGGSETDQVNGIAVDKDGNAYLTGNFSDTANFGGIILKSIGQADVFVAKYRTDGSVEWAQHAGGGYRSQFGPGKGLLADYASGYGICLDANGSAYIVGSFCDTAHFENFTLVTPNNNGSGGSSQPDIFITKYKFDGSVDWTRTADPNGGVLVGTAISIDSLANLYICGYFDNITSFQGVSLTPKGLDILVAKFQNNGTIVWANRAGGGGENEGFGIASDLFGSCYITGDFRGFADFGPDSVKSSMSQSDIFAWKIANSTLQSDTSDAVFSIVMPQLLSEDVDIGKVLITSAKDSVVQNFIRNSGSFPFRMDSIAIIGTDATQFGLVSGIPPFDVPASGSHHVEFDFHPSSAGVKSAQIEIFTQADTLFQNITGEGIQPTVAVIGNVIDFGQINIGSYKDTTIIVALQNLGNVPISFSTSSELGPDMTQFSLRSGAAPFTLSPGTSQSVTLRFAPKFIGRTSGRIGFEYGGNSPAILTVFGQGLGGLVSIADDSGYAGDHKNIPMILEKVPISSVQSEATNFSARIAYDKTVLYPSSGSVQHGGRFDTVTVSGSVAGDSILMNLPFTALLGESTSSPMNIVDFSWLDGSGQPADYDVETSSGTFYMLGVCPAGGTRLYNPDGQVSMAHINPNPANGIIHIEIQTTEIGRTQLEILNLLGQKVATISDGELKPGLHSFDFDSHGLSGGSYFLMMQTPTVRRMERVDLQK